MTTPRRRLLEIFRAALDRVDGRAAVRRALTVKPAEPGAALAVGDLVPTGPTGTAVMDLVIAYKGEAGLTRTASL